MLCGWAEPRISQSVTNPSTNNMASIPLAVKVHQMQDKGPGMMASADWPTMTAYLHQALSGTSCQVTGQVRAGSSRISHGPGRWLWPPGCQEVNLKFASPLSTLLTLSPTFLPLLFNGSLSIRATRVTEEDPRSNSSESLHIYIPKRQTRRQRFFSKSIQFLKFIIFFLKKYF